MLVPLALLVLLAVAAQRLAGTARAGSVTLDAVYGRLSPWPRPPRRPSSSWVRCPAFETLTPEDLERVAGVAVPRRFAPHEVVFRENDDSDTCYVVRSGHARALREHSDGRQITLATFGPGDIFGELAMFDDERRSATVEAVDELEVVAILGRDMRA